MGGTQPHAIVVGGSLGGLTAALTLRDAGCTVEVFERSTRPLMGQGAGIVLNPATVRYFTERTPLDIGEFSVSARQVRYVARDGSIADEQPCAYRFSSYNALYRNLLERFDAAHYHKGEAMSGFTQDNQRVDVHFASGRSECCDLLVCADGIRSTGRGLVLPNVPLTYAGYIAWRGTVSDSDLHPATFALLNEAITYHLMPNSHLLTYPIPGVDARSEDARPLVNWLWYRNIPRGPELDSLMTDKDGALREVSLSPEAVQQRHLEKLSQDASLFLPPYFCEMIHNTAQPFIQQIFDCEVPQMAFERVCLIGDAAFVARPHVAAGTAKAAEDAWKLGEAIERSGGDVSAALQHWERGQLLLGQQVLARTREAGQRLQSGTWGIGTPLPFGLYAIGDIAMP